MLLLSAAFSVVAVPIASAETLQVDPDDPDAYHSISAALEAAEPDDTILVASHQYNESVTVDVPGLTIRGEASSSSDRPLVSSDGGDGFLVSADDVTIEALVIEEARNGIVVVGATKATIADVGVRASEVNGVRLASAQAPVVENLTVEGAERGLHAFDVKDGTFANVTVADVREHGIVVEESSGIDVPGAAVNGASLGIWILASEDATVSDVSIQRPELNGVLVERSSSVLVDRPDISNSTVNGIATKDGKGILIDHARLVDNTRGVHALGTTQITVANTTVRESSEHGITYEDIDGGSVHDARVEGADAGLWMITSTDLDIVGTTVRDVRHDLLNVTGTPDLTVFGSTFVGSQARGVHLFDSPGFSMEDGEVRETACDVFFRGIRGASTTGTTFYSTNDQANLTTDVDPIPCQVQTIHAGALSSHDCNEDEWHFVITQLTDETSPPTIHVEWGDGTVSDLSLSKVSGKTGHYETTTSEHLDTTVEQATTSVPTDWSGQFELSHGPDACGGSSGGGTE